MCLRTPGRTTNTNHLSSAHRAAAFPATQIDLLKEKIQGLDARLDSRKRSPPKNAVMLTSAGAPTLPEQRRSLFRSDTEDIKLEESDVEAGIGTIPAVL